MADRTCSICGNPWFKRDWCGAHYKRWYKYGDPLGQPAPRVAPDLPGERWLPVVGWEDLYEVSDLARVRSESRLGHPGRTLKPFTSGQYGYLAVKLCRDGTGVTAYLHQLVAQAFIGPRPPGQEVRHGPGLKLDNRLVNLSYGTPADQAEDKVRDRSANRGEKNKHAKLTWEIVADIRRRYAAGELQADLAGEYGVTGPSISLMVNGKTWRHY